MSVIDDIIGRYNQMDPVERQNFWYAVIGAILVILLIFKLGDAYETVSRYLGVGANVTKEIVNNTMDLIPPET
ncbi:MAG: hypothetical protein NTU61_00010 [Candidatus Altiarchaeota archaeon]|nr:hypothetical protein [Candidatus Altiarchaeota archaeon]